MQQAAKPAAGNRLYRYVVLAAVLTGFLILFLQLNASHSNDSDASRPGSGSISSRYNSHRAKTSFSSSSSSSKRNGDAAVSRGSSPPRRYSSSSSGGGELTDNEILLLNGDELALEPDNHNEDECAKRPPQEQRRSWPSFLSFRSRYQCREVLRALSTVPAFDTNQMHDRDIFHVMAKRDAAELKRRRALLKDRRPSAPFVTGDGFRAIARVVFDETTVPTWDALDLKTHLLRYAKGRRPRQTCEQLVVRNPAFADEAPTLTTEMPHESDPAYKQLLHGTGTYDRAPSVASEGIRARYWHTVATSMRRLGEDAALRNMNGVFPWLRLDCLHYADPVFVQTHLLGKFIDEALPILELRHEQWRDCQLKQGSDPDAECHEGNMDRLASSFYPQFTLITHNSDYSAPWEPGNTRNKRDARDAKFEKQLERLLTSPALHRWFGQNLVLSPKRQREILERYAAAHPTTAHPFELVAQADEYENKIRKELGHDIVDENNNNNDNDQKAYQARRKRRQQLDDAISLRHEDARRQHRRKAGRPGEGEQEDGGEENQGGGGAGDKNNHNEKQNRNLNSIELEIAEKDQHVADKRKRRQDFLQDPSVSASQKILARRVWAREEKKESEQRQRRLQEARQLRSAEERRRKRSNNAGGGTKQQEQKGGGGGGGDGDNEQQSNDEKRNRRQLKNRHQDEEHAALAGDSSVHPKYRHRGRDIDAIRRHKLRPKKSLLGHLEARLVPIPIGIENRYNSYGAHVEVEYAAAAGCHHEDVYNFSGHGVLDDEDHGGDKTAASVVDHWDRHRNTEPWWDVSNRQMAVKFVEDFAAQRREMERPFVSFSQKTNKREREEAVAAVSENFPASGAGGGGGGGGGGGTAAADACVTKMMKQFDRVARYLATGDHNSDDNNDIKSKHDEKKNDEEQAGGAGGGGGGAYNPTKKQLVLRRFLANLKCHGFTVTPHGHGVDTHRVWEALYAGSVPVAAASAADEQLFRQLPVLLLGARNREYYDLGAYRSHMTPQALRAFWCRSVRGNVERVLRWHDTVERRHFMHLGAAALARARDIFFNASLMIPASNLFDYDSNWKMPAAEQEGADSGGGSNFLLKSASKFLTWTSDAKYNRKPEGGIAEYDSDAGAFTRMGQFSAELLDMSFWAHIITKRKHPTREL